LGVTCVLPHRIPALPALNSSDEDSGEEIMQPKIYTEQDLHEAFICGVKQGIDHKQGQPEPKFEDWIDCLFLHGFVNEVLFGSRSHNMVAKKGD
jgi:hypothetical protein